jgi:hypothetical protein
MPYRPGPSPDKAGHRLAWPLTAGFQAALVACSIFLIAAAVIATRAAVPQPTANPGSVPETA